MTGAYKRQHERIRILNNCTICIRIDPQNHVGTPDDDAAALTLYDFARTALDGVILNFTDLQDIRAVNSTFIIQYLAPKFADKLVLGVVKDEHACEDHLMGFVWMTLNKKHVTSVRIKTYKNVT